MEENKQVGTKPPEGRELRCESCGKTCKPIDNPEYVAPVSDCCTAYMRVYKIFKCGTTKVF